jgi:hypothetical protein
MRNVAVRYDLFYRYKRQLHGWELPLHECHLCDKTLHFGAGLKNNQKKFNSGIGTVGNRSSNAIF